MNSLWLNQDINNKNFGTLNENISTDVCIIGAGIFGLTCGYYLSKSGLRVTILDKNDIALKTTGHTTAKITSQHGLIYTYLIDTYGEKFAKDYLTANEEAIENIKNIIGAENIKCDFEQQSNFVYTTDKKQLNKIKKEVDSVNSLGFPANFVTKSGLPFEIAGGIQFPNQAQFNPIKYVHGLAHCIIENGGEIYTNTTVYDVKNENSEFSTFTVNGVIKSKYVIIASHYPFINFPGMYFFKMYQSSSYVIGVDTKKTLFNGMYITEESPVYSFRTAYYRGKKILLLGGADHKTGTPVTYTDSYGLLENYAKKLYPDCEVLFRWDTRDCITLDKIPYIGEFSNLLPNVYVATGFKKWGMSTSHVAGKLISDLILENKNEYIDIYKATRVNPIKNSKEFGNMLKESVYSLLINKVKDIDSAISDIAVENGGIVEVNGEKIGVYKRDDGEIFTVKPYCKHLGCLVSWNNLEKTWDCPCHGSRYDYMGNIITEPTVKNLDKVDVGDNKEGIIDV